MRAVYYTVGGVYVHIHIRVAIVREAQRAHMVEMAQEPHTRLSSYGGVHQQHQYMGSRILGFLELETRNRNGLDGGVHQQRGGIFKN